MTRIEAAPWLPSGSAGAVNWDDDQFWRPRPVPPLTTGLFQGDEGHVVTVAPLGARLRAALGTGDEYLINDAYLTTSVVRLVAGAGYQLGDQVRIPAGGRLYLNGAIIDRDNIDLGPGAIIVDLPADLDGWAAGYLPRWAAENLTDPNGGLLPGDGGFLAWTANPLLVSGIQGKSLGDSQMQVAKFRCPAAGTATKIRFILNAVAVTSLSTFAAGIYSADGVRAGVTANGADTLKAAATVPAVITLPFTAGIPLQAGTPYWVAVSSGGASVSLGAVQPVSSQLSVLADPGQPGAAQGGQLNIGATLPPSFAPASLAYPQAVPNLLLVIG